MKKLESTITNMVLVLVGVALITGCILAYVNHITEAPIKEQAVKTLAEGIKSVMGGVELNVAEDDTVKQNIEGKEAETEAKNAEAEANNAKAEANNAETEAGANHAEAKATKVSKAKPRRRAASRRPGASEEKPQTQEKKEDHVD